MYSHRRLRAGGSFCSSTCVQMVYSCKDTEHEGSASDTTFGPDERQLRCAPGHVLLQQAPAPSQIHRRVCYWHDN
jgi:hypothetical protein